MATVIEKTTTDDITGESGAQTVTFAIEGTTYQIDLVESSKAAFYDALDQWIKAARRVDAGTRKKPKTSSSDGHVDYDAKALRAWAANQGIPVPPRGRISNAIVQQYRNAA